MKKSEEYKQGYNDALNDALHNAKIIYNSANMGFADRQSLELYSIHPAFKGTVFIEKKSIMKLKKKLKERKTI